MPHIEPSFLPFAVGAILLGLAWLRRVRSEETLSRRPAPAGDLLTRESMAEWADSATPD
jgi:hypothetical protein